MRCKCVYDGNIYEGWRSFERKEVKLWLNHEKNYDLKSNFMFEENTIKIDWRTISEHLKKTIIHAINQRETKFENIYLVFSHKYSNECIQKFLIVWK